MGTHGLGPPISGNPPTGQNGWFYKTNIAEVPKIYAAHHSKFRNKVSSRKTGDGMFYGFTVCYDKKKVAKHGVSQPHGTSQVHLMVPMTTEVPL